jgi:hypothetical protein
MRLKWVVVALVLANLLVAGAFLLAGREPGSNTVIEPLNAERIAIRPQAQARAPLPAAARPSPAGTACVEWRGLAPAESLRVREALKALTEGNIMSFSEVPLALRYWVVIPPLPSRAAAAAKLAELAALGVADAFVVKDAPWTNAISLGLYASEDMARRRVQELEDKGVPGARVESQAKAGSGYYFIVRSDDANALKSLYALQQNYPDSQLTRIACP